jgi:putative PIN family toxin of toxin-antitoxin system
MKVVIDVNVWISGLLWGGLPGDVIRLVRGGQLISYVSLELELELITTLNRQKFQARLQQRQQTAEHLAAIASILSTPVKIAQISNSELRDPNDEKILATAKAAAAECLITGDQDLLILHPFDEIDILAPAQFLERFYN